MVKLPDNDDWKADRIKLKELSRNHEANCYEMAVLCSRLEKSAGFLCQHKSIDAMYADLAGDCRWVGCEVEDLILMLAHFPEQKDWKGKAPTELLKIIYQKTKKKPPEKARRSTEQEMIAGLRAERQAHLEKIRQLEISNRKGQARIAELEASDHKNNAQIAELSKKLRRMELILKDAA